MFVVMAYVIYIIQIKRNNLTTQLNMINILYMQASRNIKRTKPCKIILLWHHKIQLGAT